MRQLPHLLLSGDTVIFCPLNGDNATYAHLSPLVAYQVFYTDYSKSEFPYKSGEI